MVGSKVSRVTTVGENADRHSADPRQVLIKTLALGMNENLKIGDRDASKTAKCRGDL